MVQPFLSRIRIYPLKSFDPIELNEAEIGMHSLWHDREFALISSDGHFINGKRTGRVNELKATYDLATYTIHLTPRKGGLTTSFHLLKEQIELEAYLTDFFNEPISLVRNEEGQLMDIPDTSSVTIASEASLQSLHGDFQDKTLEDLRLRFRINIELGGVEAFGEEKLIGPPGDGIRFTIGEVEMLGVSSRSRCNVPPRDPMTGMTDKSFVKRMMKSRASSIPAKSFIPQYGTLYQFTINAHLPGTQKGKWLRLGDPVRIIEQVKLSSLIE